MSNSIFFFFSVYVKKGMVPRDSLLLSWVVTDTEIEVIFIPGSYLCSNTEILFSPCYLSGTI